MVYDIEVAHEMRRVFDSLVRLNHGNTLALELLRLIRQYENRREVDYLSQELTLSERFARCIIGANSADLPDIALQLETIRYRIAHPDDLEPHAHARDVVHAGFHDLL